MRAPRAALLALLLLLAVTGQLRPSQARARRGAAEDVWRPRRAGAAEEPQLECTLPRESAASISGQDFRSRYIEGGRPVILTGATEGWRAKTRCASSCCCASTLRDLRACSRVPG